MSFIFVGNNLATDFVNTEAIGQQTRVDLIETPGLLASWLAIAKISDAVPCTMEDLRNASKLRKSIRNCFDLLVDSRPLPMHDLSLLNKVSNELRTYLQKDGDGGAEGDGNRYALINQIETANDACALIARATCELIASPQRNSLRKCASDKCILYFVDISKNQQRQWCSMELCGNRKKAQKHYHKSKLPD